MIQRGEAASTGHVALAPVENDDEWKEYDLPPREENFKLFQDSLFQSSIIDDWEMHLVNMVL